MTASAVRVACSRLADRPTAIFGSNDEIAAGVLAAAKSSGMNVPYDLSIAGFEDSPFSKQSWPALTTAKQATEEIARHAARRLLQEIREQPAHGAAQRRLQPAAGGARFDRAASARRPEQASAATGAATTGTVALTRNERRSCFPLPRAALSARGPASALISGGRRIGALSCRRRAHPDTSAQPNAIRRWRQLREFDAQLCQPSAGKIRILKAIEWPAEMEDRFLGSWRLGVPELPSPQTRPVRLECGNRGARRTLMARVDRGHPIGDGCTRPRGAICVAAQMLARHRHARIHPVLGPAVRPARYAIPQPGRNQRRRRAGNARRSPTN